MALQIGDQGATSGMTKAIYDQMALVLEPGLDGLEESKKTPIRDTWKKTAFAVAKGVIDHIVANVEIFGVSCQGNISASVNGNTGATPPGPHLHTVSLTGTQSNVVFTQNNDGVGRVR
ncbi:MAG TPA: hypothetical protein VE008_11550 [Burkholderiales bacterium]|nr:hypothetical protein [Burkholderiales bacterium]